MTDINFLYWLRGFLEKRIILDAEDIKMINEHLALITSKELKVTVFIEGLLTGLEFARDGDFKSGTINLINNIISGTIQEVEKEKKEEFVKIAKDLVVNGRGLSGGFKSDGRKIC